MGKASTNAGIHPYLKPDFISPQQHQEREGKPLTTKPFQFKAVILTEYKDCTNNDLYFNDTVVVSGKRYLIEYDNTIFRWILNGNGKTLHLRDVHKIASLKKKCEARI